MKRTRLNYCLLQALACLAFASTAFGASWDQAVSGNWRDAGNWTNNLIPDGSVTLGAKNAYITPTGATYTVWLDGALFTNPLAITTGGNVVSPDATLEVTNNMDLRVRAPNIQGALNMRGGKLSTAGTSGIWINGGILRILAAILKKGSNTGNLTIQNGGCLYIDAAGAPAHSIQTGGTLTISADSTFQMVSGTFTGKSVTAYGTWIQTGGTFLSVYTAGSEVKVNNTTTRFIIGEAATHVFDEGLFDMGGGSWQAGLLDPTNLSFAGTLRFNPSATTSNSQLLAFGDELGADELGFTSNNFAVNILDLTAVKDGGEKLTILSAANEPTNALYVTALVGLDLTLDSGNLQFLDGAINIYYDGNNTTNDYLRGASYNLAAGGRLIPLLPAAGTLFTVK